MKVLVLTFRGFHNGFLSCYGNEWLSTPVLDVMASDGVVFDHHFADSSRPEDAWLAWLTGRYHLPLFSPDDASEPVPDPDLLLELEKAGIHTCLITDVEPLTTPWSEVHTLDDRSVEGVVQKAIEVLRSLQEKEQWLLWIDSHALYPPWDVSDELLGLYFLEEEPEVDERGEPIEGPEPLEPWLEPEPQESVEDLDVIRLKNTFAAVASSLDDQLGELLGAMNDLGIREECWIILTSDTGQSFGERGFTGPLHFPLHEELIHIPLLICPPEPKESQRISALTQSIDLMPTLLDLYGIQIPSATQGMSLLPLVREEECATREYLCAGQTDGENREWVLRSKEWLFRRRDSEEEEPVLQLYVKPEDKWEVHDVIQLHFELSERLESVLRSFVSMAQGESLEPLPLEEESCPEEEPSSQ